MLGGRSSFLSQPLYCSHSLSLSFSRTRFNLLQLDMPFGKLHSYFYICTFDVVVKVFDCDIVVKEFDLYSSYDVNFQTNIFEKDMNPLAPHPLPPDMLLIVQLLFFYKDGFGIK